MVHIWNVTVSHAGAGCQKLGDGGTVLINRKRRPAVFQMMKKTWSNSVTLRFLPSHVAQHDRLSPAWFFSLRAVLFRVLPQIFVAGTATLVCWMAAVPIKTRSWWAKYSVAATVDAAGLMGPCQRCAPSLGQVGLSYGAKCLFAMSKLGANIVFFPPSCPHFRWVPETVHPASRWNWWRPDTWSCPGWPRTTGNLPSPVSWSDSWGGPGTGAWSHSWSNSHSNSRPSTGSDPRTDPWPSTRSDSRSVPWSNPRTVSRTPTFAASSRWVSTICLW